MSALLLMLALAAAPAPAAQDCPAPEMAAPVYPSRQLVAGISGTTIVLARIDDCGRVVEAKVSEGSGQAPLDDAALETVRGWVLTPAQREKAGGPWVKLPVRFGGTRTVVPQAPKWPSSHRRPVYLLDETGIGFDSLAAFREAGVVRSEPVLKSPFASAYDGAGYRISTPFMADATSPTTFWLSYMMQPPPTKGEDGAPRTSRNEQVAVARYRLVVEDGKPVVRVGILCERAPDECERLQAFLLKGLPIAKPPR